MVNKRTLQKSYAAATVVFALTMSLYHLIVTQVLLTGPTLHIVLHVGFALVVTFLATSELKASEGKKTWLPILLVIASIVITVYMLTNHVELMERIISPTNPDVVIGVLLICVVFLAGIMKFGKTLPIVSGVLVAYAIFGQHLPEPLRTPEIEIRDQLIPYLSLGLGTGWGIYGNVVAIVANYLFLLILFGSMLEAAGGTRFVIGVGRIVGSKLVSGPAAVAVVGSSLLGSVTGSTAANISITGAFTIPLMKKAGYPPSSAGAIEAAASNGGQIMPPLMGVTAFVMAGFTGIPYVQIMLASVIPALLYYIVLLMYAQVQGMKMRIVRQPVQTDRRELLFDAPIFLVPLIVLVVLLLKGYSLMFLAFWAIVSVLVTGLIRKKTRPSLATLIGGFVRGAKSGAEMGLATALIGIIVTCFSVTGLGVKIPTLVEMLSGGFLPIALFITMIASVILGAGVPTVVAYLLVAVTAIPVLLKMGVPLLQAHYFAMFYAAFSHLTPPVAIGAIVASGIAGSKFWPTCWEAMKAAAAGFFLPWVVVYAPVVILRPESLSFGVIELISCMLGLAALQIFISNFLMVELSLKEKFLFALATVSLFATMFTDQFLWAGLGACLLVIAVISQWTRRTPARVAERVA
jgi:TRAP transporter 4TM/12TM fusion protein